MNEMGAKSRAEETLSILKSNPQALATSAISDKRNKSQENYFSPGCSSRPLSVDLAIFQFDMLLNHGKLEAAGELLEKEVRNHPGCLPLLIRLGRLDEIKGQYLNAFDLYRQAEVFAETEQERNALYGALLRTHSHLKAEKINGSNHYIIRIEGNGSPVELHYDLLEEQRREELYRNISAIIKRPADRVLEFECAVGTVSRGLAAEGFTVEAASASMTDLMLAIGVETYQALQALCTGARQKSILPVSHEGSGGSVKYFNLNLDRHAARSVEKSDVIMLLPAEAQWYLSRGPMEVAALLQLLAARAQQQLIFYLPPGHSQAYRELCTCLLSTLHSEQRLLKAGRSFTPLLVAEDSEGGRLYLTALS